MSRSRLRVATVVLVALAVTPSSAGAAPPPGTYGARLGGHTMVYLNTPPEQQEAAFRATARAGLRHLRMDFAIGIVFPRGGADFTAVEHVNALAAAYGVDVLGVITTTPWYLGECPGGATQYAERCAPAVRHERRWRRMVARVARHAPNVRNWELGNEPDGFGFVGGPHEYARWAALAAEGIRAAQPAATIAVGGFAHHDNEAFIGQALNDPAHPLRTVIDVANVHIRGPLASLRSDIAAARAVFARQGFAGPLWVTETGYPSKPEHQWDPVFKAGPRDQSRFLVRALRAMMAGGAQTVFVTLRDTREFGSASPFASEGLVRWPRLDRGGSARAKPAFWAVRRLAAKPCSC